MLGLEVMLQGYAHLLEGQRVGLLTNQTGRNSKGVSTIDLLHQQPGIDLKALFAPEHGIRGSVAAGRTVADANDAKTGLPIFSLYRLSKHRPTAAMLAQIDTLVYDIQDVGSRAYTYVWSMAEAMAACGEEGKTFVVLDRPNPLTCQQIDGPVTEKKWISFIGLYPVPRVYGMTVGEMARYLNAEYNLRCRLIVMPMAGYRRDTSWSETGLKWIASSPNIPSPESAMCFAATGSIGVLGFLHIGIGGYYPFQTVGAPWLDAARAAADLNALELPGVRFIPTDPFTPKSGLYRGQRVEAIFLRVEKPSAFLASTTEVAVLSYLQRAYPQHFEWEEKRFNGFDKAVGTSSVRKGIMSGKGYKEIVAPWRKAQQEYLEKRAKYLIY